MGKFQPGQSGNPAGRPQGSKDNTEIAKLRRRFRILASRKDQVKRENAFERLFVLIHHAEPKVSIQALQLLFGKILPNRHHVEVQAEVEFQNFKTAVLKVFEKISPEFQKQIIAELEGALDDK